MFNRVSTLIQQIILRFKKMSSSCYFQVQSIVSIIPSEAGHQKRILSQAIKDKTLNANIDCSFLPNILVVLIETKEETQTPITLKECLLHTENWKVFQSETWKKEKGKTDSISPTPTLNHQTLPPSASRKTY